MIVVGDRLRSLVLQHSIASAHAVDETSISLYLGTTIIYPDQPKVAQIRYGAPLPAEAVLERALDDSGFVLLPQTGVLAASSEPISIPVGYMGLIQTKGTLARHMVLANCADGQIDSGYSGAVTFELFNLGRLPILFKPGDAIANLYVIATMGRARAYSGRYQGATSPTLPRPSKSPAA